MLETLKFGKGNWANKTDSTLAYSDQYGNFQAIPFDFTRATTATRVNKQGLIESVNDGIARIDYSDSTQGALLLEPERTNLIINSNDFSNWSTIGTPTLDSNYGVSPDGTQNSTRVQMVSGDRIYKSTTSVSDASFSVYLKGSGQVRLRNASNTLSNEVTLTSEWVRYYNVGDFTSSNNVQVQYVSGSVDFEIFGVQYEEGSYATSYIPTNGAIATRNQEICKNATPEINSEEGVLYAEVNFGQQHTVSRYLGLSNGTNSNRVIIGVSANTSTISIFVSSGGVTQAQMNFAVNISENHKIALKYKLNDFALWIDGVEVVTDNGGIAPIGLDNLRFSQGDLNNKFFGRTSQIQVFNEALTDAQLQTLTTI